MKKLSILLGLATFSMQPLVSQGQSEFKSFELDSIGYEWTAICGLNYDHTMVVSTVASDSSMSPLLGDLRLRTYNLALTQPELSAQTLVFKGKLQVMDMVSFGNNVVISGAFKDSCFLGTDTLVGLEPQQLDAFILSINIPTQQINWVWHRAVPQNNFIHKLRNRFEELLVCGQADSSTSWLAQFNPVTGQLLWEKSFLGALALSDANMDGYGGIHITGILSDSGQLNNMPVPLNGQLTGYRSYLARYFPVLDSVAFLQSLPCKRYDVSPKLIDMGFPNWWSAPTISNQPGESKRVIVSTMPGASQADTLSYVGTFLNIENHDFIPWHGVSLMPAFLYTQAFSTPGSYVLALNQVPLISDFMHINLANGAQPNPLIDLRMRKMVFAFKTIGFDEFMFTNPLPGYSDASFLFPHASAAEPRWVMVEWSTGWVSTRNLEQLNFQLYPQPVTSGRFQVQVENVKEGISNWSIRDLHGRILQTGAFENSSEGIYCPQLAAGMYIFELQNADRKSVQKLLVYN